jgi:hypothetical protein
MKVFRSCPLLLLVLLALCSCDIGGLFSAPKAPTNLHAVAGNAKVVLDWSVASGAKSYSVYYKAGQSVSVSSYLKRVISIGSPSFTVDELTNGTTYAFMVTATNANGEGPASTSVTATPITVTAAPAIDKLDPAKDQITVSWTALADATGYTLYYKQGTTVTKGETGATKVGGLTETSTVVTGLTNNAEYAFVLTASNAAGESDASAVATEVAGTHLSAYVNDGDQKKDQMWAALIQQLKTVHPDIVLSVKQALGIDYNPKFNQLVAADDLPDIFTLSPANTNAVNIARNLKPLLDTKNPDYPNNFFAIALKPQSQTGAVYVIPDQATPTHVMYCNDELRTQLGLTFPTDMTALSTQQAVVAAYNTTNDPDIETVLMTDGDDWPMQSCLLSTMAARTAGTAWLWEALVNKDVNRTDLFFAMPTPPALTTKFVDAIDSINQMRVNGLFNADIATLPYVDSYGAHIAAMRFMDKKALYYIDGGWVINGLMKGYLQKNPTTALARENISLHVIPPMNDQANYPNGDANSASQTWNSGLAMSLKVPKESKKFSAAWNWIWFYSSKAGAGIRQNYGQITSYNFDSYDDSLDAKMDAFLSSVTPGPIINQFKKTNLLEERLNDMLQGTKTAQQVADDWVAGGIEY